MKSNFVTISDNRASHVFAYSYAPTRKKTTLTNVIGKTRCLMVSRGNVRFAVAVTIVTTTIYLKI
jgi:hypothetical protein